VWEWYRRVDTGPLIIGLGISVQYERSSRRGLRRQPGDGVVDSLEQLGVGV
jgi:hypothetical protein